MNDRTVQPLFEVPKTVSEKIATRHFGTVTFTVPPVAVVEKIAFDSAQSESRWQVHDELIVACVRGEHGERFTLDMLGRLPAQCFADVMRLRMAAARLCALNMEDVEKN
ncbi:hypothetical protein QF001_003769 [Paraburkholderia youngii]|uniref:hypothetical protein n=1 Tax=Paraburkholderia youngii TaxID=2782701 RepID=UPI003D18FFDF